MTTTDPQILFVDWRHVVDYPRSQEAHVGIQHYQGKQEYRVEYQVSEIYAPNFIFCCDLQLCFERVMIGVKMC